MRDDLPYYKKIKSIPTVNLNDLEKNELNRQRFNFYFQVGITKNDLQNKSILELCPGTGYNAYYLITESNIKKIKLLDKNPSSLKTSKKNLSKFKNVKIINSNIFYYDTKEKFDYTILENAFGGFRKKKDAVLIFKKLNKFTKKNGTIIVTLLNLYGIFSLKLKYFYAVMLVKQNKISNFDNRLNFLTKIFKSHLNYLSKNARKTEKWVLDIILNQNFISITKPCFDFFELKKNV